MKSTYDLIGTFWDGRPADAVAQTVPYDPLMPEAGTPYCLFDINGKRRGIWLSVLFAVRDEADWERVRASLAGCRQIAVIDDCRPRFQGQAAQQFHQHRLRQVLCLLRCEIPGGARPCHEVSQRGKGGMNRSIASFEELIDRYADYLSGKGIQFNPQGFPMLQPQMYLDEWPELMVPYRDRKARFVHNPSHTVLCLFTSDMRIYPRLEKALDDIPEYSRYMGAVGSDLTVTSDMDLEWQQAIMLLNQLYLATLAVNGVKIVQNLRCGSPSTITCLSCVPSGVMCATSTLGCANTESELDLLFAEKLFAIRPGKLLLYGKHDPIMERQANVAGVPCRIYPDAHTLYKQLART